MLIRLNAGPDDDGRRLDRILRKALPDCPLSLIHRTLRQGGITVDGRVAGPAGRVRSGSSIEVRLEKEARRRKADSGPSERAPLPELLASGAGILFFNKPPGLASHGRGSLDRLVKARYADGGRESLSFRPGPLHRLDRQTGGIIAFSETLAGARLFSGLLHERKIGKTYLAVVEGPLPEGSELIWEDRLVRDAVSRKSLVCGADSGRGKDAASMVRVLASNGRLSLIRVRIATGRTHQIRLQAAARGHPLAGDLKYGGRRIAGEENGVFFLHARKLEFHEEIEGLPRIIEAMPSEGFREQVGRNFGREFAAELFGGET